VCRRGWGKTWGRIPSPAKRGTCHGPPWLLFVVGLLARDRSGGDSDALLPLRSGLTTLQPVVVVEEEESASIDAVVVFVASATTTKSHSG
jgi:hypothetical protein